MDKRKPNIIAVDTVENESTLTLNVSADITDFKGHFKRFPILPGVTQIDWALHYAVQELNVPVANNRCQAKDDGGQEQAETSAIIGSQAPAPGC